MPRKLPEIITVTDAERIAAAELCRRFRRHHQKTQAQIAAAVACDTASISRLERHDGMATEERPAIAGRIVRAILDTLEPPPTVSSTAGEM